MFTVLYQIAKRLDKCIQANSSFGNYAYCSCYQHTCSFTFESGTILPYISWDRPYFMALSIIENCFLINSGINNFKLNIDVVNGTTYYNPIVTYLISVELNIMIIEVVAGLNRTLT